MVMNHRWRGKVTRERVMLCVADTVLSDDSLCRDNPVLQFRLAPLIAPARAARARAAAGPQTVVAPGASAGAASRVKRARADTGLPSTALPTSACPNPEVERLSSTCVDKMVVLLQQGEKITDDFEKKLVLRVRQALRMRLSRGDSSAKEIVKKQLTCVDAALDGYTALNAGAFVRTQTTLAAPLIGTIIRSARQLQGLMAGMEGHFVPSAEQVGEDGCADMVLSLFVIEL